MTNYITKYEDQCVTCNLPAELLGSVTDYRFNGVPYTHISQFLLESKIKLSTDALSNHFNKHVTFPTPFDIASKYETRMPSVEDLIIVDGSITGFPPALTVDNTLAPLTGVVKPPKGWEANLVLDGDTGEVTSTPQKSDKITDFSQILEEFNIDSNEFEVDGPVKLSKWQMFNRNLKNEEDEVVGGFEWLTAYKFRIKKKNPDTFDLPTLFAEVKSAPKSLIVDGRIVTGSGKSKNRTLVVPFSDLQAGKVGSRGDSQSLIERVMEKKWKLEEYIKQQNCSEAVFLDGGDVVESFENTAQQGFTNDLSIMQQLDLAGTLEQEFISLLARTHDKVTVGGVPSNHGAWRKGKDVLGRPSDDWGLFLLKQIQKAYKLAPEAYGHVEFLYPGEWEKGLSIPVQGLDIGLVHGEDSSLAQMENWWAKQVHGNSPIANADILITAHYHTLGLKPSGRSQKTGKQKYWIATPTLDNGSDWWANKTGSDSDPGLMAFVVDSEIGFDLQSFTVL
ncbi:Mre11 double-strand break endo/exonuclease [Arthrobacter phage Atuin]|nr:MRE11 double-strand break endo/exonuclease [Arthrobacter phage Atuin]